MSRIYDNQPLQNLLVVNVQVEKNLQQIPAVSGSGYLIEGCIQNRAHFCVQQPHAKVHYFVFYMKILRAHRRQFTDGGKEMEPNFSETKKVSTGYLNSSYKLADKGQTDKLKDDEIRSLLCVPELQPFTEKSAGASLSALWCESSLCAGMEFENGDNVRLKTKGNGPFIESIAKLDEGSTTVSNYAGGENVGASWTDKIMDIKSSAGSTVTENEGVDEDEWDD